MASNGSNGGGGLKLPDWGSLANIDLDKLTPSYEEDGEEDNVDYIPYNKKGRDLFGACCFNTGILWIAGMSFGGVYGASQGFRNRTNTSLKMTLNGLMNGWTKSGSRFGNTLSVLAVFHTTISYVFDEVIQMDNYVKNSYKLVTPVVSGALTGLVFFLPRSIPAATVASVGGAAASYGYNYIKNINWSSSKRR